MELHVQQTSEAVLNQDTDQWSIQLTCGLFNFSGAPPFNVEWIVGGHSLNCLPCVSFCLFAVYFFLFGQRHAAENIINISHLLLSYFPSVSLSCM